jgi:hypothetical protein
LFLIAIISDTGTQAFERLDLLFDKLYGVWMRMRNSDGISRRKGFVYLTGELPANRVRIKKAASNTNITGRLC